MRFACLVTITCALFLCVPFSEVFASEQKIAFVSMKTLFDSYYKTEQANERFEGRAAEIELKYEEMIAGLRAIEREIEGIGIEASDTSLSESERQRIQKVAREKVEQYKTAQRDLAEYDERHRKRIRREIHDAEQKIITEIRGILVDYAKEHKITVLLDSSGKSLNDVETVLYFNKKLDITDAVLKLLNEGKD